ncbi:hypothetical protein [Gallionella capsiferriformans]|uniref:Preprotein translocase subunit SecB n=1 Tax=Gallionella capsiferriformans (strain ES-2) TaxID=395494 RepID=D9SDL0_GALCS|nr:hypothetical protein [Gallionella capsiferriformans]ADL54767.1 hypothetical protein Galf_0729 [Gallionella capsiferriformans ES-2]
MKNAKLQKAIDTLQIQDVYLRDCLSRCVGDFDPKYCDDYSQLTVQYLHVVKQSVVMEREGDGRLLRVFVDTGARWVDLTESDEECSVRAMIEASFVAEYRVTGELDQTCIDEFSLKNASYHIWPYWRELLTNQCTRMHLPRLMLPAVQLAHNRHENLSEPMDVDQSVI